MLGCGANGLAGKVRSLHSVRGLPRSPNHRLLHLKNPSVRVGLDLKCLRNQSIVFDIKQIR